MKRATIIILSVCIYACGGANSEATEESGNTSSGEKSCLAQYEKNPGALLDKAFIAEISGASLGEIEVSSDEAVNEVLKKAKYTDPDFQYQWPSDRKSTLTMDAGGGREVKMDMEVKNTVRVGDIDIITSENYDRTKTNDYEGYFRRVYGVRNSQETEEMKETIERAADNSDQLDKKAAKTIASMTGAQAGKQSLPDVGHEAVYFVTSMKSYSDWNTTKLHVRHHDVVFQVEVDVSAEDAKDLEVAKQIAKQIIAKCN